MCELRRSSSSTSGLLVLRAAMAASRKKAAFSAVGARSSLWFWSCRGGRGGRGAQRENRVRSSKGDHKETGKEDRCEKDTRKERTPREEERQLIGPRHAIPAH